MRKSKKGQITQLMPLITGLVAIGIVLVIGFLIMANVKANSSVVADPNATAAITTTTTAMATIPGWLGIIVITVIGALLLGLVAMFAFRSQ